MSTLELKIGDRVRVSWSYRGKDYRPGDQGTVSWAPKAPPGGTPTHYHVSMDRRGPEGTSVIFAASDIEPDV
jgi:hypothetical protein